MEPIPIRKYSYLFINSAIILIIANLLESILHECGHFVAALLLDSPNTSLHHNYVAFDVTKMSVPDRVIISSAGPILSLVIGILFQILCRLRIKKDLTFMFENYLSIFGYIGFFGYLIIAPFFTGGDAGYVFQALGVPLWLVIMIALFSMILLYNFIKALTKNFVLICPIEALEIKYARRMFMASSVLYPVFASLIITTLLNLPVKDPFSLIAPIFIPLTILWTYPLAIKKDYRALISNPDFNRINRLSPIAVASLFAIILINRLLVLGFQL